MTPLARTIRSFLSLLAIVGSIAWGTSGASPVARAASPAPPILLAMEAAHSHPYRPHRAPARRGHHSHNGLFCFGCSNPPIAGDVSNLTGSPVIHNLTVYLIFWKPVGLCYEPIGGSCSSNNDASYESLIQRFITDLGGTPFYGMLGQYADQTGPVDNSVQLGGAIQDNRPYLHAGTSSDPLWDGDINDEIWKVSNALNWPRNLNTAYVVFTTSGIQACTALLFGAIGRTCTPPNGDGCGWHEFNFNPFGYGGYPYVTMPDDASLPTCSVPKSPNGDSFADSAINTLSHELFETVTDPQGDAWRDWNLNEIADKCGWLFSTLNPNGTTVLLNHGHEYIVQKEWSQAANGCVLPVPDAVTQKYIDLGAADSIVGEPTGGEINTPDGGLYQTFQSGVIYQSAATGAFEVNGTILAHYQALGGPSSILGYPTSDEMDTGAYGGRFNTFQNGNLYWNAANNTAFEVNGAILAQYLALGGPGGALGYPTSDETDEPDGSGRFNTFEYGSLHWNRATGAVTVVNN